MAGVAQADRLAVLDDVRDDQDLRVARQLELVQHVDLQRAEAAAEGDLLRRRDALVAEHQHVVVEVGAVDAGEVLARQGLRQVQAEHLGAQRRVEGADFETSARGGVESCSAHGEPRLYGCADRFTTKRCACAQALSAYGATRGAPPHFPR